MTEEIKDLVTPKVEPIVEKKKPGPKPGLKASPVDAPKVSPIAEAVKPVEIAPKSKRQLHEERMHKLWVEDSKLVRGMFRNHECPGTSITFPFRKYKQDPVKEWTLMDGETYNLPRAVATHINANCQYPIHKDMTDENGKHIAVVGTKIQRFSFYPTEFTDISVGDDKPDIMVVTPLNR